MEKLFYIITLLIVILFAVAGIATVGMFTFVLLECVNAANVFLYILIISFLAALLLASISVIICVFTDI